MIGEMIHIVKPGVDTWDTKIEGPYIVKRNGMYYCFYSSFTRSYEVGIAYADSMRGEWKKQENNPIMTPASPITACGHNSVFEGPNGELWMAYHVTTQEDDVEHLAIDEVAFTEDGKVKTDAPTLQKIEVEW